MASQVQSQIRKMEETLKGYLYEGPLTPFWGLLEQKTNLKRERIALGISLLQYVLSLCNDYFLFYQV